MNALRKQFYIRWSCFLLAFFAFSPSGWARSLDDIRESGFIEIAVYRDFPPYSYIENGRPAGIDIEIGKRIAGDLGVTPRWFWLTADETAEDDLRNAIWKGSVVDKRRADLMLRVPYDRDFSFGVDGYGMPRNDLVFMMAPYHAESWTLARDLRRTGEIRNLAIFRYEPIGVELDSLPDFFLSGALNGRIRDRLQHFHSIYDALDQFCKGELSAVAGMTSQVEWGLARRLDGGEGARYYDVDNDGLEAMGRMSWDIGMAVKDDYRQLGYQVESIVNRLIVQGDMREIFEQFNISYRPSSVYAESLVAADNAQ